MRSIILPAAALALCSLASAQWQTYEHSSPRFSIEYPGGWIVQPVQTPDEMTVGRLSLAVLASVNIEATVPQGVLRGNVTVVALKKTGNLTPSVIFQELGIEANAPGIERGLLRDRVYRRVEWELNKAPTFVGAFEGIDKTQAVLFTLQAPSKELLAQCKAGYDYMFNSLKMPEGVPSGGVLKDTDTAGPMKDSNGTPILDNGVVDAEWMPGGEKVLYVKATSTPQYYIYSVGIDGTGRACLTSDNYNSRDATASPDGRMIAFSRGLLVRSARRTVCLMNHDGTNVQELTGADMDAASPRWQPNENRLAFCADTPPADGKGPGTSQIWAINADGTEAKQLTPPGVDCHTPRWSPDGKRIAFIRSTPDPKISTRILNEVWVMSEGGGDMKCLVGNVPYPIRGISWSPDGKQIALDGARGMGPEYGTTLHNYSEIWVVKTDGGELTNVSLSPFNERSPQWRPDQKVLAYHLETKRQVCFIDLEKSPAYWPLMPASFVPDNAGGGYKWDSKQSPRHTWDALWSPDGGKLLVLGDQSVTDSPARGSMASLYVFDMPKPQ